MARTSKAAQQAGDDRAPDQVVASAPALQHQRGAGFGVGLPRHRDQHGRAYFPPRGAGGTRKSARCGARLGRRIAQIHDHQAEPAALDQQIGGFEGVLGACAAAHPEQALQLHAGIVGGVRGKGILGIHQRADFLRAVAAARIESSRLVRPEEAGPTISVRHPRGSPPVAESTSEMPVGSAFRLGPGLPAEGSAEDRFELFQ